MNDLARWLGEQLDEDQRVAEAARGHGEGRWQHDGTYPNGYVYDGGGQPVVYDESSPSPEEAAHIAAHDPARVLREIETKRAIIARYDFASGEAVRLALAGEEHEVWVRVAGALQACVCHLAALYADQPGYREEWAP